MPENEWSTLWSYLDVSSTEYWLYTRWEILVDTLTNKQSPFTSEDFNEYITQIERQIKELIEAIFPYTIDPEQDKKNRQYSGFLQEILMVKWLNLSPNIERELANIRIWYKGI